MKNIMKSIFILIILIIIFIILNFCKSKRKTFDDIMIFGLWNNRETKNQFEITSQDVVEIDVFTTIYNKVYKKIAPGCSGSFVIKFKRPANSNYKIEIKEKTSKPQNLIFKLENNQYWSLEEMEAVINEKFISVEKLTIDWEWRYYISYNQDIQDTKDGEKAEKYIFEIKAIIEEEGTEI